MAASESFHAVTGEQKIEIFIVGFGTLQKPLKDGVCNIFPAHTITSLKAVYEHSNKDKYTNQRILVVVEIDRYCYLVPFVKDENGSFLKTIIPSRRATRMYIGDENEKG